MAPRVPIEVFDYLDFRAFLRDYYLRKKDEGRGFSYRAFSMRCGLSAPNHLKRVIDGDRNLSPATAVKYAKGLGLEGEGAAYFCDLVAFGQARTHGERSTAYQRLTGFRGYREAHRLDVAHAAYHTTWYLPAIREMALRTDFDPDPAWVARRLVPQITRAEAARALELLIELGLLERVDGTIRQAHGTLTTGAETEGVHIASYHRTMMGRAAESLDLLDASNRDISSLTLAVGPEGIARLKERLQRFRRELLALSQIEESKAVQVVQLNLQLFPLTDAGGGQ